MLWPDLAAEWGLIGAKQSFAGIKGRSQTEFGNEGCSVEGLVEALPVHSPEAD